MKRQAIDWQKIFAKHLSYILKGTCIKCIQTSFKTQQLENNPIEKWKKSENVYKNLLKPSKKKATQLKNGRKIRTDTSPKKKKKRIYRCEISL